MLQSLQSLTSLTKNTSLGGVGVWRCCSFCLIALRAGKLKVVECVPSAPGEGCNVVSRCLAWVVVDQVHLFPAKSALTAVLPDELLDLPFVPMGVFLSQNRIASDFTSGLIATVLLRMDFSHGGLTVHEPSRELFESTKKIAICQWFQLEVTNCDFQIGYHKL